MLQENQQEGENLENLTAEELEQRKADMLKFYTDSLAYLEAQYKYEEVLMKIDEVRFKRTQIQMQYAMMMAPDPEEEEETETHTTRPSQPAPPTSAPASSQPVPPNTQRRPLKRH